MFRPLSLWQQIPCPALEARGSCTVTHCLFSHSLSLPAPPALVSSTPAALPTDPRDQEILKDSSRNAGIDGGPSLLSGDPRLRRIVESNFGNGSNDEEKRESKRRKLSDDEGSISSGSTGNGGISLVNSPAPTNKRTKTKVEAAGSAAAGPKSILKKNLAATQKVPLPASRATVAPPKSAAERIVKTSRTSATPIPKSSTAATPPRLAQTTAAASTKPEKLLTLNPRLVPIAPAKHGTRLQLLTLLHKEYVRLHEGKGDPQEMLRLALDEEEKVAREMRIIYTQAMKKRIIKFQKTSVADYQKEQEGKREQAAREEQERKRTMTAHGIIVDHGMDNSKPPLVTGLSPAEELSALGSLLQSWEALGKYGYILQPPTVEEVRIAGKGVEAAEGWESCDRCNTRFQVFDGRRESDGQLASGGNCVYHWGRAVWPPSEFCRFLVSVTS